jgi:hypothetical protein
MRKKMNTKVRFSERSMEFHTTLAHGGTLAARAQPKVFSAMAQ